MIRPDGHITYTQHEVAGEVFVTVLLPDPTADRVASIEFRLADFVAFADYTADVSAALLG
ncbi:hypothetical protein [Sphingomonas gellani]|nr:hypothetical protein [Sphingomonas gellani]